MLITSERPVIVDYPEGEPARDLSWRSIAVLLAAGCATVCLAIVVLGALLFAA